MAEVPAPSPPPSETPPRDVRPLSRVVIAGCLVLLAAAAVYLHHEVLVGGMVYHMDDAADGYYPSHVAAARALAEGTLPTWERGAWCGWPLANDPYYGVFYPASAIFWIAGAVRGLGVTIALHVLLAACAMFWLLRRRALDVGPALLGAASLAFSSFMVVRIRHIIFPEGLAWLPLILVGVEGYLQTRRRRELALAAVATGLALLCGALPLAPYFVLAIGAYVAPRLWRAERRWRAAGALLGAAAIGGLIGAAQIVPTVAHLPESPRSLATDYVFASTYAWPDARYLATLIVPDVFGGEERTSWFGVFNHWEMAGFYAGALCVVLAPLGLARGRRRPELWGLALVALLSVTLAFGDHLPVHGWFFRHVPLYAALRCPTRSLIVFLFAVPILAAEGLTWLLAREPKRRRRLVGVAVALAIALAAGYGWWRLAHPRGATPAPELAARAAFAHLTLVLGAGGAALALFLGGVVRARLAGAAFALITLAELVAIGRGYVQPRPADWAPGTERFAAVDWLIAQHPDDRFIPAARGPFRLHNVGMTYGLESAGGYDSVTVWRMVNFLYTLNTGAPYPWKQLKDDLAAGTIKRPESPLVDLMNVRWAISDVPPAPGWVERFRPAYGAAPHARHEAGWDARLAVYENPHPLPRAFVVYGAQVLADDAAQADALARLDPRKTAILDVLPQPPPIGDGRAFTPARLTLADRHHVRIEADATAPGILVLSETSYPGWWATVDGEPATLLRADYAFRGVALPAGHHVIEMRFASRPTRAGLLLSLIGLLSTLAIWLRRKRAT